MARKSGNFEEGREKIKNLDIKIREEEARKAAEDEGIYEARRAEEIDRSGSNVIRYTPEGAIVYIPGNDRDHQLKRPGLMKGGYRRSVTERERDLVRVAELYIRGEGYGSIAEKIEAETGRKTDFRQVKRDVGLVWARWREYYIQDFNEARILELARIKRLEDAYWDGYERSLKAQESNDVMELEDEVTNKQNEVVQGYKRVKKVSKRVERDGSVEWLKGVEWCVEMRVKILGLGQESKTINVNWKKQAEKEGLDPEKVVDRMVEHFLNSAQDDGGGVFGDG